MGINTEPQGRRQYPRRNFFRKAGVLHRGYYCVCETTSLGEGGISILSPEPIPVGDLVTATFTVPGGGLNSIQAEVRNCKQGPNGEWVHGLRFLNLSFSEKRQIRAFVAARTQSEKQFSQKSSF